MIAIYIHVCIECVNKFLSSLEKNCVDQQHLYNFQTTVKVVSASFADCIGLDLWQQHTSAVCKDKLYTVSPIKLLRWLGKKIDEALLSVQIIDNQKIEHSRCNTVTVQSIHSVGKVEMYLQCVECC